MTLFFFQLLGLILAILVAELAVLQAIDRVVTRAYYRWRGRRAARREIAAHVDSLSRVSPWHL